jgi:F-type H+-transporting ATPase subunit epsilon
MVTESSPANSTHCLKLDIVTPEQSVFSGYVDYVAVPGVSGELGILPHHCPLITMLKPGELRIRKGSDEIYVAIGGGFLEVRSDRIIVLADLAERDELIDEQKVAEAKKRAEEALSIIQISVIDKAEAEAALRFELARLNIVEKRKRKRKKII